jgi:NAD(P)-dependent dehydrogenase (short-subunit alcohol dehydrogenase family)
MELRGRIVGVTGGAHGIGRALVERFAAEGAASIAVIDRDAEAAKAVAEQVGGLALGADVSHPEELGEAIDRAEADLGPFDLFCSNAGVLAIGGCELPDDEWARLIDINVMAHVWAARVLVPRMLERGGGYLLQTASAAGLLSQIGSAPYSVTKHAAVGLAEWLAITYGDRGLKVSVLCPQAVATAMTGGIEGGGVAGVDGMLSADAVAEAAVAGLADERFLILPHPEVATYVQRKAADPERWLAGMRRLQARFVGTLPGAPT